MIDPDPKTWQCQCPAAGQCPVLKRRMTPRQHAVICSGTQPGMAEADRMYFIARWLADAAGDGDPSLLGNQLAAAARRLGIAHCRGCEWRRQLLNRAHRWIRGDQPPEKEKPAASKPRFVTTAELTADVSLLCSLLPTKLLGIVGVARSGLLPASLVAMYLHKPLWVLRQDSEDVIFAGHGFRLGGRDPRESQLSDAPPAGTLLLVDDTSMTGSSIAHSRAILARTWPGRKVLMSVIYRNPSAKKPDPDYWVHDLPSPHFLEWNLFNSIHLHKLAVDFDGVLTFDGTNHPQYLPLKDPLPLIVTGRSERHRLGTQAWLTKHHVRAKRLVMFPGETPSDPLAIARYKAEHWGASRLAYFVESDAVQAAEIARLVKRPVICPAAGEVF